MKSSLAALAAAALTMLTLPAAAQPAAPVDDVARLRTCVLAAGDDDPQAIKACERPILAQCNGDYALCYNRLLEGWDGLLNDSFRQLTRDRILLRADGRRLQDAQRSWIRYRDDDCKFYAGVWPGSRPPYQFAACLHRHTRERAAILTVRLDAAKKLVPR